MVCFSWPKPYFSFQINVTPNFRLGKFIQLAPPNHKHALDAIWGRLASAICSEQFDAAHEAMTQLRENIDQTGKFFVLKSKFCQGFCLKFGRAKQYVKYMIYCNYDWNSNVTLTFLWPVPYLWFDLFFSWTWWISRRPSIAPTTNLVVALVPFHLFQWIGTW